MERPRAGGGAGDLRRFRRLVELTILSTFVLIVVGGVVRVSDSGLGCGPSGSGTEGWPLCEGQVIPFLEGSTLIEFSHRALASIVVLLIALCAWRAWRGLREQHWPLRGSLAAGVLVLVQAALGGLTVERNLDDVLVAAHLGLALLLLGLLIWLAAAARAAEAGERATEPPAGLRPVALVAATLLLAAMVAGGYVAGTEKEGADGPVVSAGAHLACGEQFPGCLNQGALPFGEGRLADIHLTHRALVYAATLAILALIGMALWRGIRSPLLAVAGGLLALQLLLGAMNVWFGKHAVLVVAHLTTATLLWSAVLVIAFRLALLAQPSPGTVAMRKPEPSAAAA